MNSDGDGTKVFIQEAGFLMMARLQAAMKGFKGEFVEAHELPKKVARKIPKKLVGRELTAREAEALLKKMV